MKGMWMRRTIAGRTLAIAGMLALTTACSATSGGVDNGSSKKIGQPSTEIRAITGPDDLTAQPEFKKDLFIGVSLPQFTDPYWISQAAGIEDRAKELGIRVKVSSAGGYGNSAAQISQIQDFITQGADALIIGAVDAVALAPTVDEAWKRGVPVVFATALAEAKTQAGVYINDCEVGEFQAEYMAEEKPDAKVAVFTGPPGVAWAASRTACFVKKLSEIAPSAKIIAKVSHQMDRAVVLKKMDDILQAHRDLDFVYNNTDLQALGVIDSLRGAGFKPGEIGVTTLTLGREAYAAMERGWIQMALAERPVLQGALTVDMSAQLASGQDVAGKWQVVPPKFTQGDLAAFLKDESQWNWEPVDYKP